MPFLSHSRLCILCSVLCLFVHFWFLSLFVGLITWFSFLCLACLVVCLVGWLCFVLFLFPRHMARTIPELHDLTEDDLEQACCASDFVALWS